MTKIVLISTKESILVEDNYVDLLILVNTRAFIEVTKVTHFMGGRKEMNKVVLNTANISHFLES